MTEEKKQAITHTLKLEQLQSLLKLNKAIAVTKDKVELLKVVNDEVKAIIPFEAPGFFIVNEAENYHYDLSVLHPEMNNDDWNNILAQTTQERIPHKSTAIEEVLKSNEAKLWNWKEDLIDKGFTHPYFPTMIEFKLFYAIACPLKVRSKVLGFFSVSSTTDIYTAEQLPFFAAITDTIAIAVSNILAHEEIVEQKKIKETLLTISESIAAIQDRKQLFATIFKNIKPLIPIDDTAIVILNEDGTKWKDWTNSDNYQETTTAVTLQHNGFATYQEMDSTMQNSVDGIGIVTIDELMKANHVFAKIMHETGLKEFMYAPLICQGKVLGSLFFDSYKYNTYAAKYFEVFKAIADMIAVAVSNILAKEEILERAKEKTKLLSISEAICKINKRSELLNVIYQNIQHVFPFDSAGLFIIDEQKNVIYEILDSEAFPDELQTQLTKENNLGPWPLSSCNPQSWWMSNELVINSMEAEAELTIKHVGEEQFKAGIAYGLKHLIGMPMFTSGKKIGAICFCSKQAYFYNALHISMFKNISEQISVAVANILANEEILEREKEKTKLLEITELIASVKSTQNLLKIIVEKIKPLFNFHDCGLFVLSADETTHSDWAAVIPDVSPSEWNERIAAVSESISHKNSPVEWAMNEIDKNNSPILFDFVDLVERFPTYPQIEGTGLLEMGYRDCLGVNLKVRSKSIGWFCINAMKKNFFKKEQFTLFQSVAHSISIAVANILANEEILQKNKTKSLQIEIGKTLVKETDWQSRLLQIAKLVQVEIPYNMLLITIMMNNDEFITHGFYPTAKDEFQVLNQEALQKIIEVNPEEFKTRWQNVNKAITEPMIYTQNEIKNLQKSNPSQAKFMNYFRLHHNMVFPIYLTKYKMVALSFYSKENNPFTQHSITLLEGIQNYTGICFDRALAHDELERYSKRIQQENKYLQEEIKSEYNFDSIIGSSRVLKEVFNNVGLVAATDTTVLVLGETGTGKELIARSLHNLSPRNKNTFIKINCAALPAQLIESELFGHEKGSFTGAFEKRIGKFELADGGSIFLDEIGELPLELQAKLLRVLQEKEFERIGGKHTLKCDVRIIAATNRVLEKEVEQGRFRSDLYYRLNVFPIHLPPLRERKEDIPLLATFFAQKFCKKMNKPFKGINNKMLDALIQYEWPGNIRELENVMEQAVIVSQSTDGLELARQLLFVKEPIENILALPESKPTSKNIITAKEQKETMEKKAIRDALQKTNGRIRGDSGAAALLNLLPTTMESKMKKYGISKYEFEKLGKNE